jgi:hypothetical protein
MSSLKESYRAGLTRSRDPLVAKCLRTIEANLVETEAGILLAAGAAQYKTLWVRDFCYSVPGLLKAGYAELVERQLLLIYQHKGADGRLPRGLDVVNPKLRVVWNVLLSRSPPGSAYERRALKAEHLGEHGTPAFDSNLLFVRALFALAAHQGKPPALPSGEIAQLLAVYQQGEDSLLRQPAFSDWQDSVRREGPLLLSHLLLLDCQLALGDENGAKLSRDAVIRNFYDGGLFREMPGSRQVSLDSHLLLLNRRLFPGLEPAETYRRLKEHPVWRTDLIPGRPVFPLHPEGSISWTTRFVGLRHYHDGFVWGWLAADAYQCSLRQGDGGEAQRILAAFRAAAQKDPYLGEIYEGSEQGLKQVSRRFYRSEMPFTWTAAKWLEALLPEAEAAL